MSVVTNIVLITGILDEECVQEVLTGAESEDATASRPEFTYVDPSTKGAKVIEVNIFYVAWNYAQDEELSRVKDNFLHKVKWDAPESAVLTINHDSGYTEVIRPESQVFENLYSLRVKLDRIEVNARWEKCEEVKK